jgi:hypothetical protein
MKGKLYSKVTVLMENGVRPIFDFNVRYHNLVENIFAYIYVVCQGYMSPFSENEFQQRMYIV